MAERIAAKGDGRVRAAFEFLLAFRAGVHGLCQEALKIVDVKIDMDRRPMALVSPEIVGSLGRFAASRFLDQADLRVATLENDVRRHRSSDLCKSQGIAIKSQTFIEPRNVN